MRHAISPGVAFSGWWITKDFDPPDGYRGTQ
jgi:hypothetical protein